MTNSQNQETNLKISQESVKKRRNVKNELWREEQTKIHKAMQKEMKAKKRKRC